MSFQDQSVALPGDGRIQIQGDGMVRFGDDNHVNVTFYNRPVLDVAKSKEAGRRIMVGKVYVRIQQPGEKDCTDDPVENKPWTMQRFARQWQQYQASQQQIPDGTPVDMLPYFIQRPEIAANLHSLAVHTIEQLANLTEHGASSIGMGATQWRNMAKDFLEKANKGVGAHKMEAELAKRDNTIEVMSNQIEQLKTQLNKLMAERQGVPGTMIPQPGAMPMAQGHAMGAGFNQALYTSAPLGASLHDGLDGPSIPEPITEPPKARGGRPKGSRNKPQTSH